MNDFFISAADALFDATEHSVGFLYSSITLFFQIELLVHRDSQTLLTELLPSPVDTSLCCTPGLWTDPSNATAVLLLLWPSNKSILYLMSTDESFRVRNFLLKRNFYYGLILKITNCERKNMSLI